MVGINLFYYTIGDVSGEWKKIILPEVLWQRTVIYAVGWKIRFVQKKRYAKMDEFQAISLWIFDFLLKYVWSDAVEYLSCIRRSSGFKTGGNFVVDF